MSTYLYASIGYERCWVYGVNTKEDYERVYIDNVITLRDCINIHNKDNLDRALLLISLGLHHKEIEELLNDSN